MKQKSIAIFALTTLVIFALSAFAVFGIPGTVPGVLDEGNDVYGIRQGLDLVGGSRIVFEATDKDGKSVTPSSDEMTTAISMLKARLDALNYTEATVAKQGDNRIEVEIPSVSDPEEAVQKLGATAVLTFADADGNVVM